MKNEPILGNSLSFRIRLFGFFIATASTLLMFAVSFYNQLFLLLLVFLGISLVFVKTGIGVNLKSKRAYKFVALFGLMKRNYYHNTQSPIEKIIVNKVLYSHYTGGQFYRANVAAATENKNQVYDLSLLSNSEPIFIFNRTKDREKVYKYANFLSVYLNLVVEEKDIDLNKENFTIIDKHNNIIGNVVVSLNEDGMYIGKFVSMTIPDKLHDLFRKKERCANNQELSLIDEIENEIGEHGLSIKENGCLIYYVQVMNTNDICFQTSAL